MTRVVTFSVAASAAKTDRLYSMERWVNLLLFNAHVIAPARMTNAMPLIARVSTRALARWLDFRNFTAVFITNSGPFCGSRTFRVCNSQQSADIFAAFEIRYRRGRRSACRY